MGLSKQEIDALLALPQRGGGRRKGGPDYSDMATRTSENWFSLMHKLFDEDTGDAPKCSNPNCIDTEHNKEHGQVCAVVPPDHVLMCRRCFFGGYNTVSPGQLTTTAATDSGSD